jgi:hypothetical protein
LRDSADIGDTCTGAYGDPRSAESANNTAPSAIASLCLKSLVVGIAVIFLTVSATKRYVEAPPMSWTSSIAPRRVARSSAAAIVRLSTRRSRSKKSATFSPFVLTSSFCALATETLRTSARLRAKKWPPTRSVHSLDVCTAVTKSPGVAVVVREVRGVRLRGERADVDEEDVAGAPPEALEAQRAVEVHERLRVRERRQQRDLELPRRVPDARELLRRRERRHRDRERPMQPYVEQLRRVAPPEQPRHKLEPEPRIGLEQLQRTRADPHLEVLEVARGERTRDRPRHPDRRRRRKGDCICRRIAIDLRLARRRGDRDLEVLAADVEPQEVDARAEGEKETQSWVRSLVGANEEVQCGKEMRG